MSRPVFRRSWMNRRRYRSLMLRRPASRSTPSVPLRVSARRSPRVTNQLPPPRLHGRKGRVAIGLTLTILSFPLMASCDRTPKRPAPTEPLPQKTVTTKPTPPSKSGRTITFQGLDNDFRSSTTVLPDDRVIHHKEPP